MKYRIATIPGDGIGPDVVAQAELALRAVAARYSRDLSFVELPMGGRAIDESGEPLPAAHPHAWGGNRPGQPAPGLPHRRLAAGW